VSTVSQQPAVVNMPLHTKAPGRPMPWRIGDTPAQGQVFSLAEGWQTSLRCTVSVHELPGGAETGLHTHLLEDEGFFVLEGEVTFLFPEDGLELHARPGEFVWHPSRRHHGFIISESGPAKLLQFLLPGTRLMPELFEELGERGPSLSTAEDFAELERWMREQFGLVLEGENGPALPKQPAGTRGPIAAGGGIVYPDKFDGTVTNRPFKSNRDDVYMLQVGRGYMTDVRSVFHAFGHQTGNVFGMHEVTWRPGDIAGKHIHTLEDQCFYILDGELTLHISGPDGIVTVVAQEGDFVWAPRDMPHFYEVTGDTGAHVLSIAIPGATLMRQFWGIAHEGWGQDIDTDEGLERFASWAYENYGMFFLDEADWPQQA
jgi:quercetin dioxygenase-like cupin family protein